MSAPAPDGIGQVRPPGSTVGRWRFLILLALVLLSLAAVVWLPVGDGARDLRDVLAQTGAWGVLLFVAVFTAWNLLLPPLPLQLLAGFAYGAWFGGLLVYVGSSGAIVLTWLAAQYWFRRSLAALLARRPVYRALDRAFSEEGWRAVLLLRLSNVMPSNLANVACGCAALPLGTVLWASWLGKLPGVTMSVLLGEAGDRLLAGESPSTPTLITIVIGVVASALLVILLAIRTRRLIRAEAAASDSLARGSA